MSAIFYRYIRPVRFNAARLETITDPCGGICLRFAERNDSLWFSYSRCHGNDHFNKELARKIADKRAIDAETDERLLDLMGHLPLTQDTSILAPAIIEKCRTWKPTGTLLIDFYMSLEWHGLADALEKILVKNLQEAQKAMVWISTVKALQVSDIYERQQ